MKPTRTWTPSFPTYFPDSVRLIPIYRKNTYLARNKAITMKRIVTLVLMCAMAFQMNAQTANVEKLLKEAEQIAKLADQNPDNGKMQLNAARAFVNNSWGENCDFDRALVYAHKALKIAQEHPAPQDTLLALTCQTLGLIYVGKQDMENAMDYYEKSLDAFEVELGRLDPVTNGSKLIFGWMIMGAQPSRAFSKILEAIHDNAKAPQEKRIQNMEEAAIILEMAMEMAIEEQTQDFRYALPVITFDGNPYIIVQTGSWNIERPIVGWMSLSSPEQETDGENETILFGQDGRLTVLSEEDQDKRQLMFNCKYSSNNPLMLELNEGDARFLNFAPDVYEQILSAFREFKKEQ